MALKTGIMRTKDNRYAAANTGSSTRYYSRWGIRETRNQKVKERRVVGRKQSKATQTKKGMSDRGKRGKYTQGPKSPSKLNHAGKLDQTSSRARATDVAKSSLQAWQIFNPVCRWPSESLLFRLAASGMKLRRSSMYHVTIQPQAGPGSGYGSGSGSGWVPP